VSTPYASRALEYLQSGLGYPIPSIYPYEKHPPLAGWTGRKGAVPSERLVRKWMVTHENSNILLRLAPDVVGIDVDDYDDKHGNRTLLEITERHGELGYTHVSSARKLPSGIYFYRLHPWMETSKMRDPGEHIEVIRYEHRYAVVAPSWNQGAHAYYGWSMHLIPMIGDLPYLPTEWYVHLTRGCSCFELERAEHRALMTRIHNRPKGQLGEQMARSDLQRASYALKHADAGSRNNMLSSMAGRIFLYDYVLNGALTAEEIVSTLYAAGSAAGLEHTEIKRTLESAEEWALREGAKR